MVLLTLSGVTETRTNWDVLIFDIWKPRAAGSRCRLLGMDIGMFCPASIERSGATLLVQLVAVVRYIGATY